jgi:leukotriene-A4 hydrolase
LPEVFDPFVKSYCQHFKGKAITTDDFKSYLYEYFASKKSILDKVDWNTWFFGLGMPPVIPEYALIII